MDFGLATTIDRMSAHSNQTHEMTGGTGSFRFMATEVAKNLPYNHKADTYSFGIILYELLSCKKAFYGLGIDEYFEQVVHNGVRPKVNPKYPNQLNELMQKCWNSNIEMRPSFNEIVSTIDSTPSSCRTKNVLPKKMSLNRIKISLPNKVMRKQVFASSA